MEMHCPLLFAVSINDAAKQSKCGDVSIFLYAEIILKAERGWFTKTVDMCKRLVINEKKI